MTAMPKAMAHEGAKVGLCSPGGEQVAAATAAILGVSAETETKTALVRCGGCEEFTTRKLEYKGIPTCAAASQFYGGDWLCNYGCLGYGDCRSACEYGAITVENGPCPHRPPGCRGCSLCVKTCPKGLITLAPGRRQGRGTVQQPRQGGPGPQGLQGGLYRLHEVYQGVSVRRHPCGQFPGLHRSGKMCRLRRVRRCLSCELH